MQSTEILRQCAGVLSIATLTGTVCFLFSSVIHGTTLKKVYIRTLTNELKIETKDSKIYFTVIKFSVTTVIFSSCEILQRISSSALPRQVRRRKTKAKFKTTVLRKSTLTSQTKNSDSTCKHKRTIGSWMAK